MTQEEQEQLISEVETELERLHALYNQYFMGIEKMEPVVQRKSVERKVNLLRKETLKTANRFRFQMQVQKLNTQLTYWRRTCRQIEEGTYQPHIQMAKRRQAERHGRESGVPSVSAAAAPTADWPEDLPGAKAVSLDAAGLDLDEPFDHKAGPPPSSSPPPISDLDDPFSEPARPATPAAAAPSPAAVLQASRTKPRAALEPKPKPAAGDEVAELKDFFSKSIVPPPPPPPKKTAAAPPKAAAPKAPAPKSQGLDPERTKAIYRTYLAARKKCNEPVEGVSLDKVAKSLAAKYAAGGGAVDFKVVIRDGKAVIKTVKKE